MFSSSAVKICCTLVKASFVSSSTFSLTAQQFWPQLDFRFQSVTHSRVWFVVTGVFSMETIALHDFTARSEKELSFRKGSIIKVCDSNNNLWRSFVGYIFQTHSWLSHYKYAGTTLGSLTFRIWKRHQIPGLEERQKIIRAVAIQFI